jgi:ferredoxin
VELLANEESLTQLPATGDIELPDFDHCRQQGMIVRPLPDSLKLNGSPGQYNVTLQYGSRSDTANAGALLIEVEGAHKEAYPVVNIQSDNGLLDRVMRSRRTTDSGDNIKSDLLRDVTIGDTSGIFWLPADNKSTGNQAVLGLAIAARISAYMEQMRVKSRVMAVEIDSQLCRGCGDCSAICSYIEMQEREDGTALANVDKTLCLGCGACISACPTGAITQPWQSDKQMIATLQSLLQPHHIASEV